MSGTLSRAMRSLLLALPALMAIVFAPWLESPFSDAKAAVFLAVVGVAGGAALVAGGVANGRMRWIYAAAAAHAVAFVVSALLSKYRYMCWTSVVWAASGFVLVFAAKKFLAGSAESLLASISIAGASVAFVDIGQRLGLDLFAMFGQQSNASGRMAYYSTIGNPDWVAAFLAMCIPGAIALTVRGGKWAALWGTFAVVMGLMVVASGSRAGMLASATAIAGMVLGMGSRTMKIACAAVVLVLVALALFTPGGWNDRSAGQALRGRAVIWRVALLEPRNAIVGSGPNTFAYLYPVRLGEYFSDPKRQAELNFATYERHAQNEFVETYAEAGLLGLAALLGIFVAWGLAAWRHRREVIGTPGLAALAATLVLCCFDFPLHRAETWTLIWFWTVLPEIAANTAEKSERTRPRFVRWIGAIVVLVVFAAASTKPLVGSYLTARGERLERQGAAAQAEGAYRRAIYIEPSASAYFGLTRALGKQERYSEALITSREAERWLLEPELWILRARILRAMGDEAKAKNELTEAVRLYPYSAQVKEELSELQ